MYHIESFKDLSDDAKHKISKMQGLVKEAQIASKWSRYILIAIAAIVIVLLVFTHSKHDATYLKKANLLELLIGRDFSPLTPLNLLQFTTITFLLHSPFLLHARYLVRQAKEETVRLHSLIRERNRILFWQAQSNKSEETNKSKLTPFILEHMETNSTADVSLRMMDKLLFRSKNKPKDDNDTKLKYISAQLDELTTALKNLTPPKAE